MSYGSACSFLFVLFVCFLFMMVCVYVSLCDFVCLVLLLPFVLGFCLFVFCLFALLFLGFGYFFLPYHPYRVAGRVLVIWPGVGPELLRKKSRAQDIGSPETSKPHVMLIGESSPRDLCFNTKTQLHPTASKLQCWRPHAKQLARQEHNATH